MKTSQLKKDYLVILITGCSSGIGFALAKLFHNEKQFKVIVTARVKSMITLNNTFDESDRFIIRELDITSDSQISTLTSEIFKLWHGIDILINNAGICYRSVVEHMDEESELHQLRTNYLGPMSLIRAILPAMRERGQGHIINISSVSGMFSMPTMGSYSASKAALQSSSEALWYELKPFGVKISIIQPGFIHSDSVQNIYYSKKATLSIALESVYSIYYSSFSSFVEKLMKLSQTTPEKIAKRILKLIHEKKPALWVPVTIDAHLFKVLRHLLPQHLFHYLMYKMLPNSKAWTIKLPTPPSLLRDSENETNFMKKTTIP